MGRGHGDSANREDDTPCQLLRRKGMRLTRQRREIMAVFLEQGAHLSPAEVRDAVSQRGLCLDLSTVYRNIKLLTKEHILRRADINDPVARYEVVCGDAGHCHYLVCESCGRAIEFHNCGIEALEGELAKKTRFRISGHRLQITGVCPECQDGLPAPTGGPASLEVPASPRVSKSSGVSEPGSGNKSSHEGEI